MYKIELTTWYQETPNKYYKEIYRNLEFKSMEAAAVYLGKNIQQIRDEFPVVSFKLKNIIK